MLAFILLIQMSFAGWSDSDRKDNYVQCLKHVGDYKHGSLEDPLLAHDTCVCLVNVLDDNLPEANDDQISEFMKNSTNEFDQCLNNYRSRKGLPTKPTK